MQENKTPVRVVIWTVFSLLGVAVPLIFLMIYWFIPTDKSAAAVAPSSSAATKTGHQDFLLMQVDASDKNQPTFEAIWLIRVPQNSDTSLEVIVFPPKFFRGRNSLPPEIFKPYISDAPNTIMATRNDVSNVIDRLGGITVAGETVDGKTVWKYLDAADKTMPDDLAIRQSAVVQGMLVKIALKGKRLDLNALFVSDHPARGQEMLLEAMLHYYPIQMENFRVRIAN